MKQLDLVQGSPEWVAARFNHFCASDAPAMMGASAHMTRTELIRRKATADVPAVDSITQALFDSGHRAEAAARLIIEELIGEELYPMTATAEGEGLSLLASFDGVTMDCATGFEHKLWNADLVAHVRAKELSPMYYWQLEQQILIAGLTNVIFVCSDGTRENMVRMEYRAVPGRAEQLLAGWKQFAEDVKNYQHVEEAPAAIARPIEDLPALTVELVGQVKNSNLVSFKAAVMTRIQAINTDLQTDEDFATADKMVKFLDDGENRLDLVKSQALAQTSSIDELFRTIDALKEEMRTKRLKLNALVKARKESIRVEIVREGERASAEHLAALDRRLGGRLLMPKMLCDCTAAIRGKKTVASLRDAVSTTLANFKIEANSVADKIQINLNYLKECGAGKEFLFSDTATIVLKHPDDFAALCKLRIAEHREREEKRRQEEAERIEREAREAAALEQRREAARAHQATLDAATAGQPPMSKSAEPALRWSDPPPTAHKVQKPDDDVIIQLIGLTYGAQFMTALEWLRTIDLDAAAERWSQSEKAA